MKLSVVLPCHNEAAGLPALFAALAETLDRIEGEKEVIAVDDGSTDATFLALCALREKFPYLRVLRLARNFGKEAALTCGLNHATGNAVVTMDSDLQHPPAVILDMLEKWRGGARVVYALRRNRDGDSALRRGLTRAFYALFARIADLDLPPGAGDFRLMDRRVVEAVNRLPERNRFMKGLMTWVGFESAFVPFDPDPRARGASSFSLRRLFRLALDAITAFSTVPLRVWSVAGVLISGVAFVYAVYLMIDTLVFGAKTPGFATIMCAMLFLGGIQLISLGVIGEYVGRIFNEVKGRPLYIVADDLGSNLHNF